jgi:hypothetical protein
MMGGFVGIGTITNFEAEIVAWDEHWQRRTIENSRHPTRRREHEMHRFKSAGLAQWMPAIE